MNISEGINSIDSKEISLSFLQLKKQTVNMQNDTAAAVSVISSFIWDQLGRPALEGDIRRLICYDGHIIQSMGNLKTDARFPDGKIITVSLSVVQAKKTFGLMGRDLYQRRCIS